MNEKINCFILAAGYGERLRPITDYIPKPLLPVLGKPVLQLIIEKILALDLNKIGINVHYKKEMIEDWIKDSLFSSHIVLFPEETILDTGGALKNAINFLSGSDFLVHNGDIISDIDLQALLEHHRRAGNVVTLAVHHNQQYNHVAVDKDGLLRGVRKTYKRANPSERLIAFTGVAAYSSDFLEFLPGGVSGVVEAWLKAAASGRRVGTYDVTGCMWSDIGNPSAYAAVVMQELRNNGETAYIAASAKGCCYSEIAGNVAIEKDSILGMSSSLKNCIVLPMGQTEEGKIYQNCIVGSDFTISVDESIFTASSSIGTLIGTGGSDRQYFRVKQKDGTIVAMQCAPGDADFTRHIEYTAFFRRYGIPVPEMFDINFRKKSAFFEDLGDLSLYTWLKCPRSDDAIEMVYRRVMDILVQIHCEASNHVAECPSLATRLFDYDYLRWETNYFTERFVKGLQNIDIRDAAALKDEFHRLALIVDAFPKRIIHRDFQSQNIMITKGCIPHVIDYQGARMAPPAYDIASILWDPYAPIKSTVREGLLSYYMDKVEKTASYWFSMQEFSKALLYCRLQRHMQALGAYGFLSKNGKPYFLRHVPEGLRHLKEEVNLTRKEFPALYGLVMLL
ncbi:MAG: sugar phosphate nucleotidyltransferase [Dissulfurispiraceae bacterium]|jgi:NDP-sugar pyrophosphorylase family protein/aminoglycoside/choline kinase family phosphotransferase